MLDENQKLDRASVNARTSVTGGSKMFSILFKFLSDVDLSATVKDARVHWEPGRNSSKALHRRNIGKYTHRRSRSLPAALPPIYDFDPILAINERRHHEKGKRERERELSSFR